MTVGDRHIVVTGGASGIGAAAVRLFRAEGARVTVIDRNDPGDLAHRWIAADLSDLTAIATLDPGDRIDALVNAAGLPPRAGAEAMTLRVNAAALITLSEHLLDRMGPGTAIVNMASKAGGHWRENLAQVHRLLARIPGGDLDAFARDETLDSVRAYDLSKEAVIVWGLANVARLRKRGIRVNAVSPAAVETPILGAFMSAFGERATRGVAIAGRAGRPEEIAEVIAFLASSRASWVTGCNIECDGGLTAELDYTQRLRALDQS